MLGNSNETNKIVTPFFNTTEVQEQETAPQPIHGKHDTHKKHHYKHHQKHPKNMIKQGLQFDLKNMNRHQALQTFSMGVTAIMCFAAFWTALGVMFW